jgi:hypothetical protein
MTALRLPFPKTIDSTMIKTFRECPRKMQLEYIEHWKIKSQSVHLHAGGAFAKGLEIARRSFYEQGLSPEASLEAGMNALMLAYGDFECPPDSAKSLPRMLGALEYYFSVFPLETDPLKPFHWGDGKRGIEFTFAIPLPFDHPGTGEPLIYSGRSDMIGEMGGALYIEDDKTATQLGASWANQWDMRSQFTGYSWAARQSGLDVSGVIVRGVSILKTKYDRAQAITYRQPWMIDRWLQQTLRDLTRLEDMWKSGLFDYNLDESCNGYSGCLFRRVCLSQEPEIWLENDYERRVWDPLSHHEVPFTIWLEQQQ